MGTIRKISDLQLGSISTSKILSITTSETTYIINSGNRALEVTNRSTVSLIYGNTSVLVNSGGTLAAGGAKFWDNVVDNFQMRFAVNSAGFTAVVTIHEYAGD